MTSLSTDFYSLFDVVWAAHDTLVAANHGEQSSVTLEQAEEHLLQALKSGRLIAEGFPQKAEFSQTGQTRKREPLPVEDWERAGTDPNEHRTNRRHLLTYINRIDGNDRCGLLTYYGEYEPSWIGLRVSKRDLQIWLEQDFGKFEPEASWTSDQALIWIASRRHDLVNRASRRLEREKLSWVVFAAEPPTLLVDIEEAEQALLSDLQHGRLKARVGTEYVEREWLLDANWHRQLPSAFWPSMALRMTGERQLLGYGVEGIGKFYGSPEEELRFAVDSSELQLLYPSGTSISASSPLSPAQTAQSLEGIGRRIPRKRGAPSLLEEDRAAVEEMNRALSSKEAKSIRRAAQIAIGKGLVQGVGAEESLIRRLRDRYAAFYSGDQNGRD